MMVLSAAALAAGSIDGVVGGGAGGGGGGGRSISGGGDGAALCDVSNGNPSVPADVEPKPRKIFTTRRTGDGVA